MKTKYVKDERLEEYLNMSSLLEKKSANVLLGFQSKQWQIFDSGRKIAYRNPKDADYQQQNIFTIKDCEVSEAGQDLCFELIANNRTFLLRASNKQIRDKWISAITFLKDLPKYQKKTQKRKKRVIQSNTTLSTHNNHQQLKINPQDMSFQSSTSDPHKAKQSKITKSPHKLTQSPNKFTKSKAEQPTHKTIIKKQQKSRSEPMKFKANKFSKKNHQPDSLRTKLNIPEDMNRIIDELAKYISKQYIKYNTLLTSLKTKQEGLFSKKNINESYYLLISCKSLYPDICVNNQNLTNLSLPPWVQINHFYQISIVKGKFITKQICPIIKIIDIEVSQNDNSFKINTGEILYQYFADTKQQRQCIQECLKIGKCNIQQAMINGKISKINFDHIIKLHESQKNAFKQEIQNIVLGMLPASQSLNNIQALLQFLDNFNNYINEFLKVISHKKQTKKYHILQTIQDTLKIMYQQLKIQVKLTWDSLYPRCMIQTVQILIILQRLSEFSNSIKNYVRCQQLLEGMKQLSKIYVRDAWKNFENIILNIVQQQRKSTIKLDSLAEEQWIRTNGVTDLFKLIYDTFQIANPHWNSKIHLRNVSKLIQRALEVYVSEMRSMVDEEYLENNQLIGIANNYFIINEYIKEFYEDKLSSLHEKTEQNFDKVSKTYRQLSLIIIQKLSKDTCNQISDHCKAKKINQIKSEDLYQIIMENSEPISRYLHMAFKKKFYDHIAHNTYTNICEVLQIDALQIKRQKQKKSKQKKSNKNKVNQITEIIQYLNIISADLIQIFKDLGKSHITFSKLSQELHQLLTNQLYSDIKNVIDSTSEPLKQKYKNILYFRKDYSLKSVLYEQINKQEVTRSRQKSVRVRTPTANKYRKKSADLSMDKSYRNLRNSFTRQYLEQQLAGSQEQKSDTSSISHKNIQKLINCGYMMKGKRNKRLFQKQYFRLKNGVLYIFQNEQSDKCSNSISVNNIIDIAVQNSEKPTFLLTYKTQLKKQKQMKLRCETLQLRDRWVTSLKLQKKRISNQEKIKKKKAIKHIQAETGRKKNQFIIDYWEIQGGSDYFSYSQI